MAFRNIASHTFLIVSGGVKPSQVDVSPQELRTRPPAEGNCTIIEVSQDYQTEKAKES
jgi:hypothetical protein